MNPALPWVWRWQRLWGFEDVADLYLDSEPKLNPVGQQRLGEYRFMLLHTAEFTEKTGADTAFAAGLFTACLCRYRSVAGR